MERKKLETRTDPEHEKPSLEFLYEQYHELIVYLCKKRIFHEEDVKEVTHDILLHIFSKLDKFDGRRKLKTWITTLVNNYLVDELRRRNGKSESSPKRGISFTTLDDNNSSSNNVAAECPYSELHAKERLWCLQNNPNQILTAEEQEIIMTLFSGSLQKDIAKSRGVSISKIWKNIRSAKQKLQAWEAEINMS